jgi:hypothetical protein
MNATSSSCFHRVLTFLGLVLNETLMGLLAIAALGMALLPVLFDVSDRVVAFLEVAESAIIAVFLVEYVVHLLLAPSKKDYVRNGWRVLDLITIARPALAAVSVAAQGNPFPGPLSPSALLPPLEPGRSHPEPGERER